MSSNQGVLSILVRNRFGVLGKVAGLFSRRGYNIRAISAGETVDPAITRITVVTEGDAAQLEQISRQVCKLEDVQSVLILPPEEMVERELCLIKVAPGDDAGELMQLVTDFAAKTTSVPGGCAIIEASGSSEAIDRLVERAAKFHIVEMSRTGMTALERSSEALRRLQ